jgi:hypothetical protein
MAVIPGQCLKDQSERSPLMGTGGHADRQQRVKASIPIPEKRCGPSGPEPTSLILAAIQEIDRVSDPKFTDGTKSRFAEVRLRRIQSIQEMPPRIYTVSGTRSNAY